MPITVRKADFPHDREELIRFCCDNLPERPGAPRFDWLYLKNPLGTARTLIASDDRTHETVGIASAFPRLLWQKGTQRRGWVLGDFCISKQLRTLGPAIVLQRACLAALPAGDLWYDFPSAPMAAVYQRLGLSVFAGHTRYVKVLKPTAQANNIAAVYLSRAVNAAANCYLDLQLCATSRHVECATHEGSFGEEFTELDSRTAAHYPVRIARTAEYLNWRYRECDGGNYDVITAKVSSELAGYVVVKIDAGEATITDILAIERGTILALMVYLFGFLIKNNVLRLNVMLLKQCTLTRHFRLAGFIPRESRPVVVARSSAGLSRELSQPRHWLLLQGDRET